jgi:hypothetical protein
MSQSTPSDLAIAFRSIPRRLREASIGSDDPNDISGVTAVVDDVISATAKLMGCDATVEAIALAIEHRPLVDWSDGLLHALQAQATTAGTAVRALHDRNDSAEQ